MKDFIYHFLNFNTTEARRGNSDAKDFLSSNWCQDLTASIQPFYYVVKNIWGENIKIDI